MGAVLTDNERRRNAAGRGSYQLNTRGIDYLYARDPARAVSAFRSMLRDKHRDNVAHYNIACAFALAGDRARALRYLWRSVHSGFDDPGHMDRDPDLDSLRGDRRFEVLMRYSRGIVSARGGNGG
jgi:lipopolysaccharide biosynthesis regulator YciM